MDDNYEKISYDLLFYFDVSKDNSQDKKIQLEKFLKDYNVTKVRKIIKCENINSNMTIYEDHVDIKAQNELELYRLIEVIRKVYNYNFVNFSEADFLSINYDVLNEKVELYDYVQFIGKSVDANIMNEFNIIIEVTRLEMLEDRFVVRCEYKVFTNGIHIQVVKMSKEFNIEDSLRILNSWMDNKIKRFKEEVLDVKK